MRALTPPPRAELSDIDRQARTIERSPRHPTICRSTWQQSRANGSCAPSPATRTPEPHRKRRRRQVGLGRPDGARHECAGSQPCRCDAARGSTGVIADAIRNVRSTAKGNSQLGGGGMQEIAPPSSSTRRGRVGPWLRDSSRRFDGTGSFRTGDDDAGHVVVTFYVHRTGANGSCGPQTSTSMRSPIRGATRCRIEPTIPAATRVSRRQGVLHRHLLLHTKPILKCGGPTARSCGHDRSARGSGGVAIVRACSYSPGCDVPRLIAILGATAVGKARSVSTSRLLNGEVVSCDSTAVYRGRHRNDKVPSNSAVAFRTT